MTPVSAPQGDRRRNAAAKKGEPPSRDRLSVEAIGAIGAIGGATWAAFVEFMPVPVKAIVGSALAAVGAAGAIKAWNIKRKEERKK